MMERYLTKKSRPGRGVRLLEAAALLAGFGLFAACIALVAVMAPYMWTLKTVSVKNFLPLIPAVLLVVAMNPIGERIRARKHAGQIVKALLAAQGRIPADEAESVIGVRRAAETAQQLVEKGYMTDVRLVQGCLCLGDTVPESAVAEEIKPIFHDAEV